MPVYKHPKSIIILHWVTFLLLIIAIFNKPEENELKLNSQDIESFYPQILFGASILLLTLVRIIIKRICPDRRPPNINYFNPAHKKIAKIVYYLIYVFLLFIPIVGLTIFYQINSLSNSPDLITEETGFYETLLIIHKFSLIIFSILIFIHVSYLLFYAIKTKENVLKRMWF